MADRNRCGTCTACCKTVGVLELEKPPNTWCQHCEIGRGCRVYKTRPASCATFQCFWFSNHWIPDELRPDRCKVVFEGMEEARAVLAMVDPSRRDAWRTKPIQHFIEQLVRRGVAVVVVHEIKDITERCPIFILPEGRTAEEVMDGMLRTASANLQRYAVQEGISDDEAIQQVQARRAARS